MYYYDAKRRFFPSNNNDYSVIPNGADGGGAMRNLPLNKKVISEICGAEFTSKLPDHDF